MAADGEKTPSGLRRLPVGAEIIPQGGVDFRVWAPKHQKLDLVITSSSGSFLHNMSAEAGGWFSAVVADATAGTRYQFQFADGTRTPDPASRFQPDGPHGVSEVVDPSAFEWTDHAWTGPMDERHVIYELHVGTFTPAGTWRAAAELIPQLAELGITIIELMPVSEFPGEFNWGYDGVAPFAVAHVYGNADDMRWFVDRAHAAGIAVILDVVYNHMGPDGCYLPAFADEYFSTRYRTDWGEALNFDGPGCERVREFFLANVEYWIREFHLDGLRLDATQNIYDSSSPHILTEMSVGARAAAHPRRVWLCAENEPQEVRVLEEPDTGGYGVDAMWNDDFHHTARVALTGRAEAYYSDYGGTPQELISAAKWGFLYQGQYYSWQKKRRGTPAFDIAPRMIHFLQNHDQIANSPHGLRIHELASAAELRALTVVLYLLPAHTLLFQGQEFNASAPFLFFADHGNALARKVHAGRREFLAQFPSITPDLLHAIADPADRATFEQCRLDHGERAENAAVLRLHQDLIRIARTDRVFSRRDASSLHGAVLAPHAFALRYLGDGNDRLIIVNLGGELELRSVPEPLLAPPADRQWHVMLSTEDPRYGGAGAAVPESDAGWHIAGRCAFVLTPDVLEMDGET